MSIKIEKHHNGVVVCYLAGRLTNENTSQESENAIVNQLEAGTIMLVVDLTEVDYMNSSGLNWLLRMFTKVRNKGGDLVIASPSDAVTKILEVSKLNSIFSIYADVNAAINHFNAHEA